MHKRGVTFMGDLRANRWGYAATLVSIGTYFGLVALGANLWITVAVPVLIATGLGFVIGRHQ